VFTHLNKPKQFKQRQNQSCQALLPRLTHFTLAKDTGNVKAKEKVCGVLIWMWRELSAPKARSILAQRNALGLKEPQHARPERARGDSF
jgi:hypothetical protein